MVFRWYPRLGADHYPAVQKQAANIDRRIQQSAVIVPQIKDYTLIIFCFKLVNRVGGAIRGHGGKGQQFKVADFAYHRVFGGRNLDNGAGQADREFQFFPPPYQQINHHSRRSPQPGQNLIRGKFVSGFAVYLDN